MKVLVIFDSMYGNTEKIARAIGAGLAAAGDINILRATQVDPDQAAGVDLLVVGSPTQAFSPMAGTKDFLSALGARQLDEVKFAAFDTRVDVKEVGSKLLTFMVDRFGYAAEKIARGLKAKGGLQVVPPAGFIVDGKEGPLKAGELERATAWAGEILAHC